MFMVDPLPLEWLTDISALARRYRPGVRESPLTLELTMLLLLAQRRAASILSRRPSFFGSNLRLPDGVVTGDEALAGGASEAVLAESARGFAACVEMRDDLTVHIHDLRFAVDP